MVEILDLDEKKYRDGEWAVRTYYYARTPYEPTLTQASKSLISGASEDEAKADIAKSIHDEYVDEAGILLLSMRPERSTLLGTLAARAC